MRHLYCMLSYAREDAGGVFSCILDLHDPGHGLSVGGKAVRAGEGLFGIASEIWNVILGMGLLVCLLLLVTGAVYVMRQWERAEQLLENAVKYSPEGSTIRIGISRMDIYTGM